MKFLLATTLFASSALAANFVGFSSAACQKGDGAYVQLSASQIQDYVVKNYPGSELIPTASLSFPNDKSCPSNTEDTYKYVSIPPWQGDYSGPGKGAGGSVAVVYYKETDTYRACRYIAYAQRNGYRGDCK
ncbi:hypothetical protein HBH46_130540 [Parastagonospora nodorum]|nr:hypothetical protein HBH46_130540 [Parastagonospora nodorum]